MKFQSIKVSDLNVVLLLLKESAQELQNKGLNQWLYWMDPPQEKIDWLKEGLENNEFYSVQNLQGSVVGVFRLLYDDKLYWGTQSEKAGYVHSLVIKKEYKGQQIGKKVMQQIENLLVNRKIYLFRLDCVASNKGLCSYYESLDFQKVGEKQMPLSLNNLYEKKIG